MTEDEAPGVAGPGRPEDNSLGRLLTLSDGVFAIAMTLLALDLKVPDLGEHPGDAALRHALAANANSYWSFLLTFYVVGRYWSRHRRLMRSVVSVNPEMFRDTLLLLIFVAAMPFPASLLGRYGGEPISLALYGVINAAATGALILLWRDVRSLPSAAAGSDRDLGPRWRGWTQLVAFLLCIPAGYVFGNYGAFVLLLQAVPARWRWVRRGVQRRWRR